jgi:arylsulfatase A-like enzyme
VVEGIERRGEWQDTLVVVTSDHGEQLGDHGLMEKLGFFPQSYHIIGLWRDPRVDGVAPVHHFTENVDLLPTLADALGVEVPVQCDGASLAPLFHDRSIPWRDAAHYEWDSRHMLIGSSSPPASSRALARRNLAAWVSDDLAYVQFGDGSYRCFDLAADPTWRTECRDAERVLYAAQQQLVWRQEHLRHELTDMLLTPERLGRWPSGLHRSPLAEAVS